MEMPFWFAWGVPIGALAFGLVGYAWAVFESRRFDRKYGKRG